MTACPTRVNFLPEQWIPRQYHGLISMSTQSLFKVRMRSSFDFLTMKLTHIVQLAEVNSLLSAQLHSSSISVSDFQSQMNAGRVYRLKYSRVL